MDSIIAYSMRMMRRLNNYLMIHPVPSLIFHFVATTKLKIKKELIDSFHTSQEKEPETCVPQTSSSHSQVFIVIC